MGKSHKGVGGRIIGKVDLREWNMPGYDEIVEKVKLNWENILKKAVTETLDANLQDHTFAYFSGAMSGKRTRIDEITVCLELGDGLSGCHWVFSFDELINDVVRGGQKEAQMSVRDVLRRSLEKIDKAIADKN